MLKNRFRSFAVIAVLAFSTHAYALSSSQQASYEEAQKLYASKEFSRAYTILSSLYLEALGDAQLNFYLGRSAYEIGEFSIAIGAFERVLTLEPENVYNQLELAKAQRGAGLSAEAEAGFEKVLQYPGLPQTVRENVEYYLSALAKQRQRSFFSAAARAGYLYDSNVNFGSSDDTYTLPAYGTYPATRSIGDSAHEETLRMTHLYDFGGKGGAMVRNQAGFYNRKYSHEHPYDLMVFSYNPAMIYSDERSLYEVTGGIDNVYLGGKNYYLNYSLQPKWMYSYSSSLRQTLALKAGRKDYVQTADSALESRDFQIQGGLEYYFTPANSVRGEVVLARQIKNGGDRVDINYNETGANILYTNQWLPMSILQANLSLKRRDYDDYSSLFRSNRIDNTVYGSINFIQRLTKAVSLEVLGNYNHTDSTISIYHFDKYTLGMSLSTRF